MIKNKKLLEKKLKGITNIFYIKLGTKEDGWEDPCIEEGKIDVGFKMHESKVFKALGDGNDKLLMDYWKDDKKIQGVATNFVNQTKRFYNDDGNTLWVTFAKEKMYYCFSDGGQIDNTKRPTSRKTDENGWIYKDIKGTELSIYSLSSSFTKTRSTQNTIPDSFSDEIKEYIKRKIKGLPFKPLELAESLKNHKGPKFDEAIKKLIKHLHQDDFELLIEIIFSKTAEWCRTSLTGGNQKTIDFAVRDFERKTDAFVQVKTKARQSGETSFEHYIDALTESPYQKMFFVYHTGSAVINSGIDARLKDQGKEVEVWDLDRVFKEVRKHKLDEWIFWAARRC